MKNGREMLVRVPKMVNFVNRKTGNASVCNTHNAMKKTADYIKKIEIDYLWSGRKHVEWELNRHVNILSGVNGVGKSTILNRVIRHLMGVNLLDGGNDGVHITLSDETADGVLFDVIRSFDNPVVASEVLEKITDRMFHSELDIHLYQLQRRFLEYQVNLSNRMLQFFTSGDPDAQQKVAEIAAEKTHFFDVVDSLFKQTHKKIVRNTHDIVFRQHGENVMPYQLSSGEKQMLIILFTVLVQNRKPCVLLMDEPEASLHVEWQQRLISLVMELNPEIQLIVTTHSPAVIMDGWTDCVTDVEDIVTDNNTLPLSDEQ